MKSIKAEILIVSPSSEHFEEQLTVETSTFKLFGVADLRYQLESWCGRVFLSATPFNGWSIIVYQPKRKKKPRNIYSQQTIAV